jgi:catechol 2,3-dioxygenase-like lactoylglutathione lyase family enzyme
MTSGNHHLAIRVADAEKAAVFYEKVFGASRMIGAFEIDGEVGAMVSGGPEGTAMKILPISFDDGGAIELYEFKEPRLPTKPIDAWESTLMHYAIEVDDTDAALARVEEAGGKRFWPEVQEMGPLRIIYVHDLDGNVIEVIDGTMDAVIDLARDLFFGGDAEA